MSPLQNEENACFCGREVQEEIDRVCSLDGIIDLAPCHNGVPIALSKPHFFMGSPILSSKLNGLTPDQPSHESYFDIDPVSLLCNP